MNLSFDDKNHTKKTKSLAPPFTQIYTKLSRIISPSDLDLIPKKWEKIGDILIIKFPGEVKKKATVAKVYADILQCRTVLEDVGGIKGVLRKPQLIHLYGDINTETTHLENGIYFKLNVSQVMFSSGNINERIRMASIGSRDEVVVDFFAGIGYFSLPMAIYQGPHIFACELNPIAHGYLQDNIAINNVSDRVVGLLGDCREVAPKGSADRVIMGYLDAHDFLSSALGSLKPRGGIIHYHEACPNQLLPHRPIQRIQKISQEYNREAVVLHYHKIKSYTPGVSHVVLDVQIV